MRYSIKRLLIVTAIIAFAVWFVRSAYVGLTQVETAENVEAVDWLPDSASNVSYYRSYMATAYEFDTTETEFVSWSRWGTSEIEDPVTITRYKRFAYEAPSFPPNASGGDAQDFEVALAEQSAIIDNGLYYGYLQGNGGGVWVGYDRELGRAFYYSAPR